MKLQINSILKLLNIFKIKWKRQDIKNQMIFYYKINFYQRIQLILLGKLIFHLNI